MNLKKAKTMALSAIGIIVLGITTLMIVKGIKYAMLISVSASIGAIVSFYFTRQFYVKKL